MMRSMTVLAVASLASLGLALSFVACHESSTPTGASESNPNLFDNANSISHLTDVNAEGVAQSLPLACDALGDRRPTVRVEVRGSEVTVRAKARGVGVPGEVDAGPAIVASVGRFRFWPDGRHQGAKVTSEVFPTMRAEDFPVDIELQYRYPSGTTSGEVLAALDYEFLSACFDELTGELEIGGLDEFGTCRPGAFVILQCDRGLSYRIN